jgi:UV DNA damage endonuclease
MHPDQFTLINALKEEVVENSKRELRYHADVLDLLNLGDDAKIQIHVGGVYGDKQTAMDRFTRNFDDLEPRVRRRLVIENDDRNYSLADYLTIHERTGIPVLFDVFHHELKNEGEPVRDALQQAARTWQPGDGVLMCDYSSQQPGGKTGQHAHSIDLADFDDFIGQSASCDFDLMLEIKDKERSALMALESLGKDPRFVRAGN